MCDPGNPGIIFSDTDPIIIEIVSALHGSYRGKLDHNPNALSSVNTIRSARLVLQLWGHEASSDHLSPNIANIKRGRLIDLIDPVAE